MRFYLLFLISLLFVISCKQVAKNDVTPTPSVPSDNSSNPTGSTSLSQFNDISITINDGDTYTTSNNINIALNSSEASHVYLTSEPGCLNGGNWQTYEANKSFILTSLNQNSLVYVKFKDANGTESNCISDSIIHDDTSPSHTSFSINNGAIYTQDINLNLSFTADDATEMYITSDSSCASDGSWEAFSSVKSFTSQSLNSINNLYVKFRDIAGNESSCIHESIIHDNISPTNPSININTNSSTTNAQNVTLALSAIGASQMYITNESDCATGGVYETYLNSKTWTLAQTNTTANVYVKFKDAAGNESACIGDAIIHDSLPPVASSIKINSDDEYTTSSNVNLNLSAADASEMYVTNTVGCNSGGVYESYNSSKSWTLGQLNAASNVYVKFKDTTGNESSCISDSIIHDNTPPSSTSIVINSGDSSTSDTNINLTLNAIDATEMYITNEADCNSGGSYENYTTSKSWSVSAPSGYKNIYVKFKDSLGNESDCISDSIHYMVLKVVDIFSGPQSSSTCALFNDGHVQCWGGVDRLTPTKIDGLENVEKMAMGGSHVCALIDNGSIKCWGGNSSGQLGNNSYTSSSTPVNVAFGPFKDVAAGSNHTCAVTTTGKAQCWGESMDGSYKIGRFSYEQTLNNNYERERLPGDIYLSHNITKIAASHFNSCAITTSSDVYCWGDDSDFVNGASSSHMPIVTVDNTFGTPFTNPIEVATAHGRGCILESSGSIVCWGVNNNGYLGNGTTSGSVAQVSNISSATQIAVGNNHNCARLSNGTVKCWGDNFKGQIGDGTTTNRTSPVIVPGLTSIVKVAAGQQYTCALDTAGDVWCWGQNSNGKLGNGTTTDSSIPIKITSWQ